MTRFNITFSEEIQPLDISFSTETPGFDIGFGIVTERDAKPPYEGDYEITPTNATQILPTEGHTATANFIINPIPQNYGLITWNGSIITVS